MNSEPKKKARPVVCEPGTDRAVVTHGESERSEPQRRGTLQLGCCALAKACERVEVAVISGHLPGGLGGGWSVQDLQNPDSKGVSQSRSHINVNRNAAVFVTGNHALVGADAVSKLGLRNAEGGSCSFKVISHDQMMRLTNIRVKHMPANAWPLLDLATTIAE